MKDISKFQLIFSGIFIVAIFAGVLTLAISRSGPKEGELPQLSIWGTLSPAQFDALNRIGPNESRINAKYTYRNPTTMYASLLEAIAVGSAPDMLIMTDSELYTYRGKTVSTPYASYSERTYKDSFIEGAEIFLTPEGITAFPLAVDPLVMYWNRDMLNTTGFVNPPRYWDELYGFAEKVTQKDADFNIQKSAVALGEYNNILHAKDILSALIYQAGGKVTFLNTGKNSFESGLQYSFGNTRNPTQSSIDFFLEFTNPQKATYSWNRSFSDDRSTFIAGDLALYFGRASEISEIRAKNPNLNFDVATLPQARGSTVPTTYGSYIVIVSMRSSTKLSAAYSVLGVITGSSVSQASVGAGLMPVRRDVLSVRQERADRAVFYDSAFKSRGWIDPSPQKTSAIFAELINYITSGRLRTSEAINRASQQLGGLF